jgi:hypothetical protein
MLDRLKIGRNKQQQIKISVFMAEILGKRHNKTIPSASKPIKNKTF